MSANRYMVRHRFVEHRTQRGPILVCGLLCVAVLVVVTCSAPDHPASDWSARRDSTGFLTLVESPSICHDCVALELIALLGDTAGPGRVEWTESVTRDSLGNYWVGQDTSVKVFDSDGNYLRDVGRRGNGPMEFEYVETLHTDRQGRVHILDGVNRRETIVGTAFELCDERPLPDLFSSAVYTSAVPLQDGERYVFNAWIETPDRIGLPLHIVAPPNIVHSFGVLTGGTEEPLNRVSARRLLAVSRSGRVFSSRLTEYLVEAWTQTGRRITGYKGPQLNDSDVVPGVSSSEKPPSNKIWAIQVDQGDHLWVVGARFKEDWRDRLVEVVRPDGNVVRVPRENPYSPRSIDRGRIDVIDLNGAAIIASTDREEVITEFIGEGLGLEVLYPPDDEIPRLAIWSITLDVPNER